MKFPYGISDFKEIVTNNYFYCDRTEKIPFLEESKSILFLRPRRFGKSLLLSMLANYYDVALADQFEDIFGNTRIGKNPTKRRNSYFILKWDFSCVDPAGAPAEIRQSLYDHINDRIKAFVAYYKNYIDQDIEINPDNALSSMESLLGAIRNAPHPVYLLIDEYDNFANEVMTGSRKEPGAYESLVYGDGLLQTLFKAVKAAASESLFERTFITGVSPVAMSDITSGYNIAENIYLEPEFNDLCGFCENEIQDAVNRVADSRGMIKKEAAAALEMMRSYYNGYAFSPGAKSNVYNPTLCLYFLKRLEKNRAYPDNMLDANLATDDEKLHYISRLMEGEQLILDLIAEKNSVSVPKLEDRFGIRQMREAGSGDVSFIASFLYYFGILTMAGKTKFGEFRLCVPNLVVQGLYVERIGKMLLPEPQARDAGMFAAKKLYQENDIKPICEFIEKKFFAVFSNRDYRWANELTVKTAFLTLLYNDILYMMDSEAEIEKTFTDLTMIIRPDMRRFEISDILLEFKFVTLKDAGLTGDQAKKMAPQELENVAGMRLKMEEAMTRLGHYGDALERKHGNLRLKRFAVVSLGFERLWAKPYP